MPVLAVPVLHGEVAAIVCTALTLHVLRTFRKGTVPVLQEVRDNVRVGSSISPVARQHPFLRTILTPYGKGGDMCYALRIVVVKECRCQSKG